MTNLPLNLAVGSNLHLEPLLDELPKNLRSELIGYAMGRSIILTHPCKDGIPVHVEPGDIYVVRVEHGDTRVTFEAKVLTVHNAPFPHLHLSYPDNVQSGPIRIGHRVAATHASLRLVVNDGREHQAISVMNISPSGGCLVSEERLGEINDHFHIEIKAGQDQTSVVLPCVIRYIREVTIQQICKYHHGVLFTDLDSNSRLFLERLVHESITRQRQE